MNRLSIKYRQLFALTLLLAVFVSYPLQAQDQENEIPTFYNQEIPDDKSGQNCAIPISSLGGQGHKVSPVEGGLTTEEPDPYWLPSLVFSQEEMESGLDSNSRIPNDPGPVAILIVDAFNPDTPNADNIYDLSAAFEISDESSLTTAVENGNITHGALVMNHVNVLLQSQGMSPVAQGSNYTIWVREMPHEATIIVMAVNAVHYGPATDASLLTTTATVRDEITNAMTTLNDSNSEIRQTVNQVTNRFVINMSFSILPCETIIDFYSSPFESFIEYFQTVTNPLLNFLPNPDPLLEFIASPGQISEYISSGTSNPAFVPVASAGNSQFPFPFAPALAPEILSVSAQSAPIEQRTNPVPTAYANMGEYLTNGGWYRLIVSDNVNGGTTDTGIFYLGTSFSAPTLSTRIAFGLTKEVHTPCISNPGDIPTIAYAGTIETLIKDAASNDPQVLQSLVSSGVWQNLDYSTVVQSLCHTP